MVRFEEKPERGDELYAHQVTERPFMTNRQMNNTVPDGEEGAVYIGRVLKISPGDELYIPNSPNVDSKGIIILINTGVKNIVFKVKTNAPDKYRVRPCTGVIKPGEEVDITVTVHPEFQSQVQSMQDKFLVMAIEVNRDHISAAELQDIWKNCPKERVMEHKIRCNFGGSKGCESMTGDSLTHKVDILAAQTSEIRRTQMISCTLLVIVIILVLAILGLLLLGGRLPTSCDHPHHP